MQEISLVVSNSWKTFLGEATETYHKALMASPESPAVEYLKSRGLSGVSAQFFKLGIVESPLPGHEQYQGKLALPYLTSSGVVSMRFRALPPDDASGPKYLSVPGDIPRLFNPADLSGWQSFVCICEGEFDAMTAHQAGLPAIGIPGVNGWKEFYSHCFKGYESVFILADNDDKGQGETFAEKVAGQVANARIVLMPSGHDVNSFVHAEGADALKKRLEIKGA